MLNDTHKPNWINKRKLTINIGKHSYMAIKEDLNDTYKNRLRILDAIKRGLELVK